MKTLKDIITEGNKILEQAGITDAKLDSYYLAEYVIEFTRTEYLMKPDRKIRKEDEEKYFSLITKRAKHVPLQHLTGMQEFMGFSFIVNENVLIPRQDTEILVEEALKNSKAESILDVCTGSGCIIISLAKMMKLKRAVGIDISKEALIVANKNNKKLDANVEFIENDLLEKCTEKFDIITSNPPYIKTKEIESLMKEVREYDPIIALDGMEDGLYFYKIITKQAKNNLRIGGKLIFEIGYDQSKSVSLIMEQEGYIDIKITKDLSGLDRVIEGKIDIN